MDPCKVFLPRAATCFGVSAHLQILEYGQRWKYLAAFRNVRDTQMRSRCRGNRQQIPAFEPDDAGSRAHDAGDSLEQGGFPCSVRSDDRGELARVHPQTDVIEYRQHVVTRAEVLDLKHWRLSSACRDRRRLLRCHA